MFRERSQDHQLGLALSFSHLSPAGSLVGPFLLVRMATSTRSLETSDSDKVAPFRLLDVFASCHRWSPFD
jgi:hypothetical protein